MSWVQHDGSSMPGTDTGVRAMADEEPTGSFTPPAVADGHSEQSSAYSNLQGSPRIPRPATEDAKPSALANETPFLPGLA